jgi:hypothetical protein
MAQQIINTGVAANDGKGDSLLSAGIKINANFTELYLTKVPDFFGNANKVLSTNGTSLFWVPSTVSNAIQTTNVYNDPTWIGTLAYSKLTGKPTIPTLVSQLSNDTGFITTNGLPSQSSNSGKFLTTDGSSLSWVSVIAGSGTVTQVSFTGANGFTGTVATSTTIPNISIGTSITGILKGNGTAVSAATAGTDYLASLPTASTSTLGGVKVDGSSVTINGSGVISVSTGLTGSVVFKGGWNASTNTPTLASGTGSAGWMYIVTVGGTQNLGGGSFTYTAGDLLVYDGTNWIAVAANNGVVSFNTRTGAVTLTGTDVTTALGFTPYNSTNPNSYISSITSSNVTTALGFTPLQTTSLSVATNSPSGAGSLSYSGNVFTFTPPLAYSLPTATVGTNSTGTLGGVKVDGTSITITGGVIAVSSALTSATQFKGNWDASANTPTLSSSLPAGRVAGWQYIVSSGGTQDIGNGSTVWTIGDLVIYDGAKWVRIPSGNNVVSFNTRQGAVTLTSGDVTTALGFTPGALAGSSSITTLGTIATGNWNGTVITGQYGGTGVANTGKTITLGGNLTTSGAFTTTLTVTAVTAVTLPISGTLATRAGVETLTNKTLAATTIAGHLIPDTDVTYDLGSGAYRFRDLYLSGSSIKLGGATITASGSALAIPASSTLTTPIVTTNITTPSTTFALLNTTATTVNFAGAATTALTIGASTAPITGFTATATTSSTASSLGYLGLPQSATATTATLAIGDAGKHIYVTSASQTITIPANASVAYPIGTTITFIAGSSATTVSIAIATDTMRLAGAGTTGTRTLAANGMATAVKVAATTWYINGTGLT